MHETYHLWRKMAKTFFPTFLYFLVPCLMNIWASIRYRWFCIKNKETYCFLLLRQQNIYKNLENLKINFEISNRKVEFKPAEIFRIHIKQFKRIFLTFNMIFHCTSITLIENRKVNQCTDTIKKHQIKTYSHTKHNVRMCSTDS